MRKDKKNVFTPHPITITTQGGPKRLKMKTKIVCLHKFIPQTFFERYPNIKCSLREYKYIMSNQTPNPDNKKIKICRTKTFSFIRLHGSMSL